MEKKIRIITHSGTFHVDELLAVATLELYFNGAHPYEVIRSRDPELWKTADYLVDVGMEYDPERGRFDHHQKGGGGERNNIPYSSFGLVWKEFGEAVSGSKEVAAAIERKLCYPVDLGDNGIEPYNPTIPGVHPYLLQYIVIAFRPTWKEGEIHDIRFIEMVAFVKRILEREIKMEQDKLEGMKIVHDIYAQSPDKQIIIIEGQYPWHEVLPQYSEPLYVVKPKHQSNYWEVECVREDVYRFANRKNLPEAWAGLIDGNLEAATGVPGSVFCHNKRYVAVAKTRDAALRLAEIARNA